MSFKYIYLIIIAFSLVACDSHLDLNPKDSIIDEDAFQTIEDVQEGMIGVYALLNTQAVVAISSRASDDLRLSEQNRGQGIANHNWEFTASNGEFNTMWLYMYHAIDRANRMIEIANKFDVEDTRIKQVIGECLFIRAYCHFELVRGYSDNYNTANSLGIAYMKMSQIGLPKRDTQVSVYENLYSDINESINLMSADFVANTANKIAAQALQARVALYQQNYDLAIEAASEVIDNSGFTLADTTEVRDVWNDVFGLQEKKEVIFKRSRVENESALGNIFIDPANDEIYFSPSHDLMNQYTNDDYRKDAYFGINSQGNDVVAKHDGKGVGPNIVDEKMLRLSEVYLIRSEAYIMKNMVTEAKIDLDFLRRCRIENPVPVPVGDQAVLLKALQEERRRELPYEGHRFIDLKRWGLGITRLPEDSELASGKELSAGDYRFVFPIPQDEMFANDNMEQNKGYN